ncbi:hypothetical protein NR402_09480 [Acidithiobacillus ferrooxidans]|uniref:hypothetical protein n=1 Tax=Acidithiobacillus ferrooxidans TaxID=920 RepID=UPI00214AA132|nr:hypothetical protein [Acidithiobacillus ferrooxidans]MCR2830509.1 hypothetical protein [Acidithiobacillus ferrooxidans]
MRRGKGSLRLVVMNKNRGHLVLAREKPGYRDDEDNYRAFLAWFSWPIPPLVLH